MLSILGSHEVLSSSKMVVLFRVVFGLPFNGATLFSPT